MLKLIFRQLNEAHSGSANALNGPLAATAARQFGDGKQRLEFVMCIDLLRRNNSRCTTHIIEVAVDFKLTAPELNALRKNIGLRWKKLLQKEQLQVDEKEYDQFFCMRVRAIFWGSDVPVMREIFPRYILKG